MAELSNLESKLGEVLGLAMAAQGATEKVQKLDDLDEQLGSLVLASEEDPNETSG
jgi:hypothetical protein